MSHKTGTTRDSVVVLKTIVNLQANDQSCDLGKAINVYKPQDVKNPFLEELNPQPNRSLPQAQVATNQRAGETKRE
jgi:hypothetical protein